MASNNGKALAIEAYCNTCVLHGKCELVSKAKQDTCIKLSAFSEGWEAGKNEVLDSLYIATR